LIGLFISALAVVGSRFVQPESSFVDAPSILFRPLVALDTLGFYLHKVAWPVDLTFDYSRPPRAVIESRTYLLTSIAPLFILLLVVVLARRGLRQPACLAAVALSGVLPVLGLISFDMQQYSTPADHYLYPSLIALGWLIALLTNRSKPVLTLAASLLLIAWAVQSNRQTDVWQNSIALYEHRLSINDESWPAHQGLAAHFIENAKTPNDLERALHHAERATEINPSFALGFISKSNALRRLGRTEEALEAGREANRLEPDDPATLANLTALLAEHARSLDTAGQPEHAARLRIEAVAVGERAARLFPDDADAQLNFGLALLDADRPQDAVTPLDRAIHLRPAHIPSLKARAAAEAAKNSGSPPSTP
jgi:tetratricopeptide (TPR) repeat protein